MIANSNQMVNPLSSEGKVAKKRLSHRERAHWMRAVKKNVNCFTFLGSEPMRCV